jgi:hypothetical protein
MSKVIYFNNKHEIYSYFSILNFAFETNEEKRPQIFEEIQVKIKKALVSVSKLLSEYVWLENAITILAHIKKAIYFQDLIKYRAPFSTIIATPAANAKEDDAELFKYLVQPSEVINRNPKDFIKFCSYYINANSISQPNKWIPLLWDAFYACKPEDKKSQDQLLVLIARVGLYCFERKETLFYKRIAYEALRRLSGTQHLSKDDNEFVGTNLIKNSKYLFAKAAELNSTEIISLEQYDNFYQPIMNGVYHLNAAEVKDDKMPSLKDLRAKQQNLLTMGWKKLSKQYRELVKSPMAVDAKNILFDIAKAKFHFERANDNYEALQILKDFQELLKKQANDKYLGFFKKSPYLNWLKQTLIVLQEIEKHIMTLQRSPQGAPGP